MLLTPAVDGVAKSLSAEHSATMIAFVRYLFAGLTALAVARATGRRIVVPREDRLGQLARTALIIGAMTALIAALGMVPMAKAVGGFLIAPIVSGLLGILVWREPPTVTRLAGSAISFMGAALMLRPEAGLEPGCLFALLGGVLLGAYLAATRGARSQADALSTLALQSLLGAGLLAPFALAGGLPALTPGLLLGALALGAISAALPLPHRRRLPALGRHASRALSLFQPPDGDGGGLCFLWGNARGGGLVGGCAIVGGGLVAVMGPGAFTMPRVLAGRVRWA